MGRECEKECEEGAGRMQAGCGQECEQDVDKNLDRVWASRGKYVHMVWAGYRQCMGRVQGLASRM